MVAIIDYGAGNLNSIEKAIRFLGAEAVVTQNPTRIREAERVILPGVGCFGDAMGRLKDSGLAEVVCEQAVGGKPFLGICLGMQLLFERSQESPGISGLGILKGEILRIPNGTDESGRALKIPHIGWNSLQFTHSSRLFRGLEKEPYVYFVHSYYLRAREDVVTATAQYGVTIHAAVEKGNLFACQFHPEKSSSVGLQILKNFLSA